MNHIFFFLHYVDGKAQMARGRDRTRMHHGKKASRRDALGYDTYHLSNIAADLHDSTIT